jgi:hypothetical protein
LKWTDEKTKPPPARQDITFCRWMPDKAKIIVLAEKSIGIYDVQEDKMIEIRDHFPFDPVNFVRPDGKYFLTEQSATETGVCLLDSEGWQHEFKSKIPDEVLSPRPIESRLIESYWRKNTLICFSDRRRFLIDTDARTITEDGKPSFIQANKTDTISMIHTFPGTGSALCVFQEYEKTETGVAARNKRIELQQAALAPLA